MLLLSLLWSIVGTVSGFAAGWLAGSFSTNPKRGALPWVGAGVGAAVQAGWSDPLTGAHAAIIWGAVGTIAGPMVLLLLMGLSFALLWPVQTPRQPFRR